MVSVKMRRLFRPHYEGEANTGEKVFWAAADFVFLLLMAGCVVAVVSKIVGA
jgi:hypothetical protein